MVEEALTKSNTQTTYLDADTKRQIADMLRHDVPITDIVDHFNLADPDLLYEVFNSEQIDNKYTRASDAFVVANLGRTSSTSYSLVEGTIRALLARRGKVRVLEHGCGDGTEMFRLAQIFPEVHFVGIELSQTGIDKAKMLHQGQNTEYYCADGYLFEDKIGFDLVYHVNVLEHVPDPIEYLEAGIRLTKPNGHLVFGFPRRAYWKFWGFPKFVLCKIFGRTFETHSQSDDVVAEFHNRHQNLEAGISYKYGLFPPRRIYRYVPKALLRPFGNLLETFEGSLRFASLTAPLMFSVYSLSKEEPAPVAAIIPPIWKSIVSLPLAMAGMIIIYPLYFLLMAIEVMSGQKRLFRQV